jgi:hypothetical protein
MTTKTTYTNYDIIITAASTKNLPEVTPAIHFSLDDKVKDFPFDVFLEMLQGASKVEVQKWKPKSKASNLYALLINQDKASADSEDVPAF